ncbi:MAG: glycoside hydrolase/phage tail family protein [Rhizobiales bacterium]|nr:glycoside hydrolase/phage tail family protein [Hyphomicrobiales bacterium]
MSGSEGSPIPRVWGRMRVASQVIWATNFEEVVSTHTDKASGKGGGGSSSTKITEYKYFANFAVALCEGEIDRIGRAWADGKEFDMSGLTVRLYTGSETQEPDSLIVAKEGADNAPAYRGLAYLVFERLPVAGFGNRLPQLSFEVIRAAGGAAAQVQAVNIIPGSTEFGYDTTLQTRLLGNGVSESENAHAAESRSDWAVSLDDLTETCGNVGAASLVVAWFANDLRCATAVLKPGVENSTKVTEPNIWKAAGIERATAHVVSQVDGAPAFGGTPSDASVVRAIQDLRARGLATVLYPFVILDIPAGNGLADPYGGSEQEAYPWRGRITCDPAPERAGSPDKTAACATQLASFIGTAAAADFSISGGQVVYSGPAEWSYRRMVLHCAKLCALAGGVDGFLIGSELRGLTTLRGSANSFPFVAALVALAAEVKTILPAAKVSYAADWSEYFGHQPTDGSADVFFHLDPLWSSANVDFIGIDNYMPLADWRDGSQHVDRLAGRTSIYDLSYLEANIAGGEGFDWSYASAADRQNQVRSAIGDGAYGKPWVFRYKDVKSWWLNPHHDRPGGVEQAIATAWVPQSKPIWFTEAGCPAVDKGANEPNAFFDAKSGESRLPYFSSGQRDDFMQVRYIEAIAGYWSTTGAANPISSVYGAKMVDPARIFLWAWDARPFPFFPARNDVWADSTNYGRGHWLNGRIAAIPLGQLIAAVCAAYGFAAIDVAGVEGLVDGFTIDRSMSARDALEDLMAAFAIDAVERDGVLVFRMRGSEPVLSLTPDGLVETVAEASLYSLTRAQETELPATVQLAYMETALDYRRAAVEARRTGGASKREVQLELACAVGQAVAQMRADVALQESWAGRDSFEFALPPTRIELEPGDVVGLDLMGGRRVVRLESVSDGDYRKFKGRSHLAAVYATGNALGRDLDVKPIYSFGTPDAAVLDLPLVASPAVPHSPWLAASAKPWPGRLAVYRAVGATAYTLNRTIDAQATKGRLLGTLAAGPLHVFDRGNSLTVKLEFGALASVSEAELLQGANVAAVGGSAEGWEIVQFVNAQLVGPDTYKLSVLLRGQSGSEPEMADPRAAGSRFVLLNGAVVQPVLTLAEAGLAQTWRIGPAQYDLTRKYVSIAHTGRLLGLRPLSPSQLRARLDGGDVVFSWIRRTRIDGDSWEVAEVPLGEDGEAYALDVLSGATVKRSASVVTPAYRYAAADIATDFGAMPADFTLRIAQVSATYGRGANLLRTVHV